MPNNFRYERQSGRVPLSNSTTYKFLSKFPMIQSSSKTCVNYFMASATMVFPIFNFILNNSIIQGFVRIQEILKELHAENLLDTPETATLKHAFDEFQVYFRTDFKLHIKEQSRIADHCMVHALSDPIDARFSAPPCATHDHDWTCPTCEKMDFVFRY